MNKRMGFLGLLVWLALATAGADQPASQQVPVFKAEVNYVEVDALVTDRDGQAVRDLKRDEFAVFEDGKPQAVAAFSFVDIPIEREEQPLTRPAVTPDIRTNARPFDGRVYVMVIDDAHTLFGRSDRVKRAAHQFVEKRLGANDLMAVVHTAGPSDASQEFTNDKRLLLAAVDRTMGKKLRSSTLNKIDQYNLTRGTRSSSDPIRDPEEAERGFEAHTTLKTLKGIAEWFSGVRGRRKTILFVSEGIDYDISNVFDNPSASTLIEDTRAVVAAAARSNVSIYAIDPRGLTSVGDEEIELQSYPDDTSLGLGHTSLLNEVQLSQDSLRTLANETGGFAIVNTNDFRNAYDRIVKENSSYYMLAYYPPSDRRDGKFHKIEVRVTRPGLKVQARKGYAAPKGKAAPPERTASAADGASAAIREALDSPLPVSGLTFTVFAAPFRGTRPNASVLLGVEMRGRDLKPEANDRLELSYLAVDTQGKVKAGKTDALTLSLRPETRAHVQQTGLRLLSRLDLPAGRYQLHVAAHDPAGGHVGSVTYDLEVPEYAKEPLAMSGLVLTSATASTMPTAKSDELLKAALPGPPTAFRQFPVNDVLVIYSEVYDSLAGRPHAVEITTTLTADDGTVAFRTSETRGSSDLSGTAGSPGVTTRIPLADCAPGAYVLKVEARARVGRGAAAAREIPISLVSAGTAPAL